MKKLLTIGLTSLLLLTSCSKGYYGHIPRAKTKKATVEKRTPQPDTSVSNVKVEEIIELEQVKIAITKEEIEEVATTDTLSGNNDSASDISTLAEALPTEQTPVEQKEITKQSPVDKLSDGDILMFTFLIIMAILGSLLLLPVIDAIIFWWEPVWGIFHVIGTLLLKPLAKRLDRRHKRKGGFDDSEETNNNEFDALGKIFMTLVLILLVLLIVGNVALFWWEAIEELTVWGTDIGTVLPLSLIAGLVATYWFSFVSFLINIISRELE